MSRDVLAYGAAIVVGLVIGIFAGVVYTSWKVMSGWRDR